MAAFLTTTGNSFYIEQIIIDAQEKLVLVTPYLQLSTNLTDRIADAIKRGVHITIIYGKNELSVIEKRKLEAFENIRIYFSQNLHAKCYFNESKMIISSMNLYEFSERNNREMGILIEKDSDDKIYNDALKEVESILNAASIEKNCNNETDNYQPVTFIEPRFFQEYIFHLPGLYQNLKRTYLKHEISFVKKENKIVIRNFIFNLQLIVHGSVVELHYTNNSYGLLETLNRFKLNNFFTDKRIYWNSDHVKIYPLKHHAPEMTIIGCNNEIKEFLRIIHWIQKEFIFPESYKAY